MPLRPLLFKLSAHKQTKKQPYHIILPAWLGENVTI